MKNDTINVTHVIPYIGTASFGLGPVALNLCREQNNLGYKSKIWCLDDVNQVLWASSSSGLHIDQIQSFPIIGFDKLGLSLAMEREASLGINSQLSVVHQHGLWTGLSRVTNIIRKRHGIPTIITPHGFLQSWALNKSMWKKRLALAFYENNNLRNVSCLHAVGEPEVDDCRKFGLSTPIAIIPNGISDTWLNSEGSAGNFRKRFNISPDSRVMLFLSRITPKKGLLMLLQAINSVKNSFADWVLVIAGADEFGHKKEVETTLDNLGLKNRIIFTDLIVNQLKRDAFAAAELFILPSYSEGAPIVILEALATGVPVIATKASPWEALNDYSCGWCVDISTKAIAEALEHALNLASNELECKGRRGKELVAAKYTWAQSAQMTKELYEWLLGLREKPFFVIN